MKSYKKLLIKNIMCLFPKLILNKKYLPNKKNGYRPPKLYDERVKYVPIGCGNCIECRKQKANEWRTRLLNEINEWKNTYFVTLTLNNETFEKISTEAKTGNANVIGKICIRRFLERWRKKYKKSVTHWLISELGIENDRLHFHGFIFSNENVKEDIEKIWQYGLVYIGDYCNNKTINYCVKYAVKIDIKHKNYKQIICCSKGLGKSYIEPNRTLHRYNNERTKETYTLPNGFQIGLPIYYRNHLFTEEEREKLWLNRIDKHTIYVNGIEVDIGTERGIEQYNRILKEMQERNYMLGFGDDSEDWQKKEYTYKLHMLNAKQKLQKQRKTAKT